MKKLLIGFLSFTLLLTNVNADIQKDNKIGVYLSLISEEQNNYQYRDYNDIEYLEYTNWQNECIVDPKEYEIEYRTIYSYQFTGNINNIILSNYDSNLSITKLNIYNNLELVNYNINSFADIISIDLDKDIPISNLTIELEFNNEQELNYKLSLNSNEEKIYEQELNTKIFKLSFNDIYYTNIKDNKGNINYIDVKNECRYRKYLVYNYNIKSNEIDNSISYFKTSEESRINEIIYPKEEIDENNISSNIEENNIIKEEKNNNQESKLLKNIKPNNKYINTLKVSNDKSIAKYLIIVVIGLTITYIIISNKNILKKKK